MITAIALAVGFIAAPPPQFDHAFRGRTVIQYGTYAGVAAMCGGPAYGCSFIGGQDGVCVMKLVREADSPRLRRHERAHCNGWPAWHP
jgi:hypothetical protein